LASKVHRARKSACGCDILNLEQQQERDRVNRERKKYRKKYSESAFGYARVSRSTITDTELQIGKFVLPKHGSTILGESDDDRYLRTRKEDMPTGYLFNEAYFPPHGKNGHVYHVFNYPLHYSIPDHAPL